MNAVTGFELARDRKAFGNNRLDGAVVLGLNHAARAHKHPVQPLGRVQVQPDQAAYHRVRNMGQVNRHDVRERRFHVCCTGNLPQLPFQRKRCAFQGGKYVGKSRVGVIQVT